MPGKEVKRCYICSSDKFVDDHHYDCREGTLSPETIPLCRRCHRTYHDRGIGWFDDEYLDKAIEIENKAREIHAKAGVRSKFHQPGKPLGVMTREDVKRSDYWNKIHNVLPKKRKAVKQPDIQMRMEFVNCQKTK